MVFIMEVRILYWVKLELKKTIKLTTGLVMSKNSPSGNYIARVIATGIIGPKDDEVSSLSESSFKIINYNQAFAKDANKINLVPEVKAAPEVLGVEDSTTSECQLYAFLLIVLLIYIILKIYKKYCTDVRKSP